MKKSQKNIISRKLQRAEQSYLEAKFAIQNFVNFFEPKFPGKKIKKKTSYRGNLKDLSIHIKR